MDRQILIGILIVIILIWLVRSYRKQPKAVAVVSQPQTTQASSSQPSQTDQPNQSLNDQETMFSNPVVKNNTQMAKTNWKTDATLYASRDNAEALNNGVMTTNRLLDAKKPSGSAGYDQMTLSVQSS